MCLSRHSSWQSVPFPSRPGTTDRFWYVCAQTPLSSYQRAASREYLRLNDVFVKKAPRKGPVLLAGCSLVRTMLNKCPKQTEKEAGACSRIKGVHKGSYRRWTSNIPFGAGPWYLKKGNTASKAPNFCFFHLFFFFQNLAIPRALTARRLLVHFHLHMPQHLA